jgi:SlyX protein
MEHRIIELELKAAEQQQQLDDLSHVVYQQQKELDALKATLQVLARKSNVDPNAIDDKPADKPPHY